MEKGYLTLILHAHLPFVRHPEHEYFLEEDWLYEAITETYIPILDVFEKLTEDSVDFRLTISLSPPLVEMFNDELLRERYDRHLNKLLELSYKEIERNRKDAAFEPLAKMYNERLKRAKYLYEEKYKRDLTGAFKYFQDIGKIEITTCGATHGFLCNFKEPLCPVPREGSYHLRDKGDILMIQRLNRSYEFCLPSIYNPRLAFLFKEINNWRR